MEYQYLQHPKTFREHINYALRHIPRDYVDPMRVSFGPRKKVKTYYNDCYLKFECPDEKCRAKWSSIVGHCYIKFQIVQDDREIKNKGEKGEKGIPQNILVNYDFFFYRQKCEEGCQPWANGQLIGSEKVRISENFARFICKMLRGESKPSDKQKKDVKMIAGHRTDLCEACLLNKCRNVQTYAEKINLESLNVSP